MVYVSKLLIKRNKPKSLFLPDDNKLFLFMMANSFGKFAKISFYTGLNSDSGSKLGFDSASSAISNHFLMCEPLFNSASGCAWAQGLGGGFGYSMESGR